MIESMDTPADLDLSLERCRKQLQEFEEKVDRDRLLARLQTANPAHPILMARSAFLVLSVLLGVTGVISLLAPFVLGYMGTLGNIEASDLNRSLAHIEDSMPHLPGLPALPVLFAVLTICMAVAWVTTTFAALALGREAPMMPWEAREHQKMVNEISRLTTQRAVLARIQNNTPKVARPISTPAPATVRGGLAGASGLSAVGGLSTTSSAAASGGLARGRPNPGASDAPPARTGFGGGLLGPVLPPPRPLSVDPAAETLPPQSILGGGPMASERTRGPGGRLTLAQPGQARAEAEPLVSVDESMAARARAAAAITTERPVSLAAPRGGLSTRGGTPLGSQPRVGQPLGGSRGRTPLGAPPRGGTPLGAPSRAPAGGSASRPSTPLGSPLRTGTPLGARPDTAARTPLGAPTRGGTPLGEMPRVGRPLGGGRPTTAHPHSFLPDEPLAERPSPPPAAAPAARSLLGRARPAPAAPPPGPEVTMDVYPGTPVPAPRSSAPAAAPYEDTFDLLGGAAAPAAAARSDGALGLETPQAGSDLDDGPPYDDPAASDSLSGRVVEGNRLRINKGKRQSVAAPAGPPLPDILEDSSYLGSETAALSATSKATARLPRWGRIDEPWLEETIQKAEQLAISLPVQAHLVFSQEDHLPFTLVIARASPAIATRCLTSYLEFLSSIPTPPQARVELTGSPALDATFHQTVQAMLSPYFGGAADVEPEPGRVDILFHQPDAGWQSFARLPIV